MEANSHNPIMIILAPDLVSCLFIGYTMALCLARLTAVRVFTEAKSNSVCMGYNILHMIEPYGQIEFNSCTGISNGMQKQFSVRSAMAKLRMK